ncbi:MAG: uracil-DNA glycosylase [Rickettsiales bacterium]|nr:uracil-DNA glycosylase [Rickettsiales bacterium]
MNLPSANCPLCPRLVKFREANQAAYPTFYNGVVPPFGSENAELLIVGLAPGLKGANATGRPFTGDYAGDVLYPALLKYGLAEGIYQQHPQDGLELKNTRITNAVRCVPPENKPTTPEIATCNPFLRQELEDMPHLRVILSLGSISHKAVLKTLGYKQSHAPFQHSAVHPLGAYTLLNSYHTSRYNINTGRLTVEMFDAIILQAKDLLTR